MNFNGQQIDIHCGLNQMGIDSFMAVEIRNSVFKVFGINISTMDLLKNISINQLAMRLVVDLEQMYEPAIESLLESIESIEDREVESLLTASS